jgi:putative FmdB family regulatory protein
MPTYDYVCQICNRPFEVRVSISEYARGIRPRCPSCGSEKAIRTFTQVNVLTSRGKPGAGRARCGPGAGPECCGG